MSKILQIYKEQGLWWIRVFGFGLHAKNILVHDLLFSERSGYSKSIIIGKWIIKLLPRL